MYKLFENFLYAPVKKQLPEQFYVSFAQYFYPYLSYSFVQTWLDEVAEKVLSCLKDKYPNHSIFSVSREKFSFWRDNNINDNFWDEREARQIMCVLYEYMFSCEMERDKLFEMNSWFNDLLLSNIESLVSYCKLY